jgi:hypothetical protein
MSPSLVNIRSFMVEYIMSIFLVLGVLGNLINIYMFTRNSFLRNSCSLYLLAASIINVFTVSWGIFQPLYNLENIDPSTNSFIYCKLRLYTIHTLLMIGRSLIVFACIDRYALCSQSVRLRSFCQRKIAIRVIIANILIWPCLTIHIPILQTFNGKTCSMTGSYVLIYGLYSTMAAGILPPLLMTIFSILTIRHRRELRMRINRAGTNNRRNRTLVIMLSSEVIVYVTTTSLYPAITLYRALTNRNSKSVESSQIETFVNFLGGSFLIYLNSASVFYVFFIVSKHFRKECKTAVGHLIKRITRRRDRVEPMGVQPHGTHHCDTPV